MRKENGMILGAILPIVAMLFISTGIYVYNSSSSTLDQVPLKGGNENNITQNNNVNYSNTILTPNIPDNILTPDEYVYNETDGNY